VDPFERTASLRGESPNTGAWGYGNDFFAREFWRFVMVQQYVEKLALHLRITYGARRNLVGTSVARSGPSSTKALEGAPRSSCAPCCFLVRALGAK
jgi:hypothetical protein